MKLMHIDNVERLFEVINKCKGDVYLVGKDIRLNMKSQLTKYFALAQVFSSGEEIEELELVTVKPEDTDLLMDYMMRG